MATMVQCSRCHNERESLPAPPFRAGTKLEALGKEIQEKICRACYKEWLDMSVKLVNETRMDTTDPRGQAMWLDQMKTFLGVGGAEASSDPWARFLNQRVKIETTAGAHTVATLLSASPDALNFAEFDGGSVPEGFTPSTTGARGSATLARNAIRTIESA